MWADGTLPVPQIALTSSEKCDIITPLTIVSRTDVYIFHLEAFQYGK